MSWIEGKQCTVCGYFFPNDVLDNEEIEKCPECGNNQNNTGVK